MALLIYADGRTKECEPASARGPIQMWDGRAIIFYPIHWRVGSRDLVVYVEEGTSPETVKAAVDASLAAP